MGSGLMQPKRKIDSRKAKVATPFEVRTYSFLPFDFQRRGQEWTTIPQYLFVRSRLLILDLRNKFRYDNGSVVD